MLVVSLPLQQVKEVGTVTTQGEITTKCKIQNYIIFALTVTIFGIVVFAILHSRTLKLGRGCVFSNAVKIIIFILDVQYYVPYKTLLNCRKHPSIQNYRHNKTRKCKTKLKLYLGYFRNRLEGGQYDF